MDRNCTSHPRASVTSTSSGPLTSTPPPPPRDLPPPRRLRPGCPRCRRSAPRRDTARDHPCTRRQNTSHRRPPRHLSPRPPSLLCAMPPRGVASRPCGCPIFWPRRPGAQPCVSAPLGASHVNHLLPCASDGSPTHPAPPPRRHPSTPAIRGLRAAHHRPRTHDSLLTCCILRTRPRLRLAELLLPSLGRTRSCLQTRLHGSALRGDLRLCRHALCVPQDPRLHPSNIDPLPSSDPPTYGNHHFPSPIPTRARPTQAPHRPPLTFSLAKPGVPTTTPPRRPSTPTGPTGPLQTPTQAPHAMLIHSPSPPQRQAPLLQPPKSHHRYLSPPTLISPLRPFTPRSHLQLLKATPRTLLPASRTFPPRPHCARHYGTPCPCRRNTHTPPLPRPTTTSGPQLRSKPALLPSRAAAASGSLGATPRPTIYFRPRVRIPAILPAQATGVNLSFSLRSLLPPTPTPALSPAPAPAPSRPSIPRHLRIPLRLPHRLLPHSARHACFVPTSPWIVPLATLLQQTTLATAPLPRPPPPAHRPPPRHPADDPLHLRHHAPGRLLRTTMSVLEPAVISLRPPHPTHT